MRLSGKKVLLIISFKGFKDEEYFVPKEILENAGNRVIIASTQKGIASGADGGEASVELILEEVKTDDYDAVIFVGGPGAFNHIENNQCHRIAKEAVEKDKILGAICIAPSILARAGVLRGKRATIWSSPMDKKPIRMLEEGGAKYADENVVIDGKIITANGPHAAKEFGEKIVELITYGHDRANM